eukprot:TRINITY_DN9857_c0_g2_i1.p1 TRINITY_DN9857_c0_g2~~TRINITY_DN9857_c0_g2_i1.p1  ORF type:complete len:470 (+),score=82.27 TRINITY_DN9857_c0_g2_i1:30-1439(+)
MADCSDPSFGDNVKIEAPVTLTVLGFSYVCGLALFLWRRNHSPIKERPQLQTIMTVSAFTGMAIMWTIIVQDSTVFAQANCFASVLLSVLLSGIASSSVIYRIFHLEVQHKLVSKKLEFASSRNLELGTAKVICKLARFRESLWKWGLACVCMSLVVFFIISGIVLKDPGASLANDGTISLNTACLSTLVLTFGIGIIPVKAFSMISGCVMLYRIRHIKDNFYLKEELLLTFLVYSMFIIYIIIMAFQKDNCHATVLFKDLDLGQLIFMCLPSMTLIIHSFAINVVRSIWSSQYVNSQKLRSSTASKAPCTMKSLNQTADRFKKVLDDDEGSQLFQKFLEQEWSVENILFWKVVVSFRTRFPSEDASAVFKDICERYVTENSALCVNLSYEVRKDLLKVLGSSTLGGEDSPTASPSTEEVITADVFACAEEEIFSLMMRDPFRRFCLNPDPAIQALFARLGQVGSEEIQ